MSHRTESKNLPSASGFARYTACPGSFVMEHEQPDEESPDATQGILIHAVIANPDAHTDTPLDFEVGEQVSICHEIECELLRQWCNGEDGMIYRERRLWIRDTDTLEPIYSGKPDGVWINGERAIVWDFKTGRAAVPEADRNWQLRALAALVAENYGATQIVVAIIQPWASPQLTQALYDKGSIAVARAVCVDTALRVARPGQNRFASPDACRYCRAKAVCPEANAIVPAMAQTTLQEEHNGDLDAPSMLRLLDVCGHAERVIGAVRARAKRLLAVDPQALPGWILKISKPRETIDDTAKVFERAIQFGIDAKQFVAECKISKGSLSTLVRGATGMRGTALDNACAMVTIGCMKQGNPSVTLERIELPEPKEQNQLTEHATIRID